VRDIFDKGPILATNRQTNAFKAANFEIQAIAWRHDRGI